MKPIISQLNIEGGGSTGSALGLFSSDTLPPEESLPPKGPTIALKQLHQLGSTVQRSEPVEDISYLDHHN